MILLCIGLGRGTCRPVNRQTDNRRISAIEGIVQGAFANCCCIPQNLNAADSIATVKCIVSNRSDSIWHNYVLNSFTDYECMIFDRCNAI